MVSSAGGHGFDAHLRGPSFLIEPPSRVEFSNSSGAWLDCAATGNPTPNIDWSTADGLPATDVPGVRRVLRNGTLVLLPFQAAAFRQDVHSAAYRCVASNSVGRVLSRDVQVRASEYKKKSFFYSTTSDFTSPLHFFSLSRLLPTLRYVTSYIQSGSRHSVITNTV